MDWSLVLIVAAPVVAVLLAWLQAWAMARMATLADRDEQEARERYAAARERSAVEWCSWDRVWPEAKRRG